MKILTICPSVYPVKLNKMLESFEITRSKDTDIVICSEGTVTQAINNSFNNAPEYDFYFIANDDISFKTPLWDLKLAKKGKIIHGTDGVPEGVNGQFMMIDGDISRAVGWLQMPTLNRYCGDVVWRFIGDRLEILEHVEDVIIEHNWDGCAEPMVNQLDMEKFSEWLPNSHKDIEKIRKVL